MKILVVTPRFAIAGVPLAQVRFAQALSRAGHDVDIVIGCINPGVHLPEIEGVHIVVLGKTSVRRMLFPLRKYICTMRPEVIFSAEDHLNAAVLLAAIMAGSRAKISGSSRVTPYDTYSTKPFSKRWLLKQLVRAVMWRADALTCVSLGMVEEYRAIFGTTKHTCVYNMIDPRYVLNADQTRTWHRWLDNNELPLMVAAGTLAPWKGYADLLYAMKEFLQRRKARLLILGDGPQRRELEQIVQNEGLSGWVEMIGAVSNTTDFYRKASVFIHPAILEGLGNVIVEAMICGCTPVVTDCPTGPREIVEDGRYGYVVPIHNPGALSRAIENALDNPISKGNLHAAVDRFTAENVIRRHFDLLGIFDAAQTGKSAIA